MKIYKKPIINIELFSVTNVLAKSDEVFNPDIETQIIP